MISQRLFGISKRAAILEKALTSMLSPTLLFLLLAGWLESQSCVSGAVTTTTSTPFCGQTPCKPPGKCCGKHGEACCTSSGGHWYIYLIVAIVVVGIGIGVGVGIYFWRKRGGGFPYSRS